MKQLLTYINEAEGSKIIDAMKNALKEELNAWYGYVIVQTVKILKNSMKILLKMNQKIMLIGL